VDYAGPVTFTPYIDGNVVNQDSNYDEKFWDMELSKAVPGSAYLMARTRKTGFAACMAMGHMVEQNGNHVETQMEVLEKKDYVSNRISLEVGQGEEVILYKFVSVLTSMNHKPEDLVISAVKNPGRRHGSRLRGTVRGACKGMGRKVGPFRYRD
jgi:maltose phosphorylase